MRRIILTWHSHNGAPISFLDAPPSLNPNSVVPESQTRRQRASKEVYISALERLAESVAESVESVAESVKGVAESVAENVQRVVESVIYSKSRNCSRCSVSSQP